MQMLLPSCNQPPLTPSRSSFLTRSSDSSSSSVLKRLRTLSSKARDSEVADLWVGITILISSGTYFFDYGSNIATAWKYYVLEYKNQTADVAGLRKYGKRSEFPGIFPGIIAIMLAAHILNALVFYLHLDKSKEALRSAYLLPVIYLRKLVLLVWRTGTFQGVRDLRSPEIDAVYNILAAALETGPQLILQFHVFAEIGYLSPPGTKVPGVLLLSIVASFISGAFNGGQAMATACQKATLVGRAAMGIVGGLHIVSAILLRSMAFELVTEEGFYHYSSSFRYYYVYILLAILVPSLAFWRLLKPTEHQQQVQAETEADEQEASKTDGANSSCRRISRCLSYAYLSITLGPLYPLVSHEQQQRHRKVFWVRLCNASLLHLSLDLAAIVLVCGFHGKDWLTPCYSEWSRAGDRAKQPVIYQQSFVSCTSFKALLVFSLVFYVVTLVLYLCLDVYIDSRLEKNNSIQMEPAAARGESSDEFNAV